MTRSGGRSWRRRGPLARLWCLVGFPADLMIVPPAWSEDGVTLMFQRLIRAPRFEVRQQMLRRTSTLDDPGQAAEDMAQRLLSTSPGDWVDSFG